MAQVFKKPTTIIPFIAEVCSSVSGSWDVNVEAAIPLEDAAHAAEDQVLLNVQWLQFKLETREFS